MAASRTVSGSEDRSDESPSVPEAAPVRFLQGSGSRVFFEYTCEIVPFYMRSVCLISMASAGAGSRSAGIGHAGGRSHRVSPGYDPVPATPVVRPGLSGSDGLFHPAVAVSQDAVTRIVCAETLPKNLNPVSICQYSPSVKYFLICISRILIIHID
jgi:hypothetical protein